MTDLMRGRHAKLPAAPASVANINEVMKDAVEGNADLQYYMRLMCAKEEGVPKAVDQGYTEVMMNLTAAEYEKKFGRPSGIKRKSFYDCGINSNRL